MDFEKRMILKEMEDMSNNFPNMTMMEIIYSFTRPQGEPHRTNKLSDILNISDEDVITKIERAKTAENDE